MNIRAAPHFKSKTTDLNLNIFIYTICNDHAKVEDEYLLVYMIAITKQCTSRMRKKNRRSSPISIHCEWINGLWFGQLNFEKFEEEKKLQKEVEKKANNSNSFLSLSSDSTWFRIDYNFIASFFSLSLSFRINIWKSHSRGPFGHTWTFNFPAAFDFYDRLTATITRNINIKYQQS